MAAAHADISNNTKSWCRQKTATVLLHQRPSVGRSISNGSSRLLSYHPAPIAGASARLWMPDSVLHTLPRTDEGRFSSHYRLSPQTHPDVLLMHPDSPIPHLHQREPSGRFPCHLSKKGGQERAVVSEPHRKSSRCCCTPV